MKKVKLALGIIFSISTLLSCSTNNIEVLEPIAEISSVKKDVNYYPLKKGMSWTYRLEQFQDGQSNNKFKEMTMSVIEEKNIDNINQFVLNRSYPDAPIQPKPSLAKVFPDRIEMSRYVQPEVLNATNEQRTKDYIISLKFPVTVGESWEGREFNGGTETISVKGFEVLETQAGKFNCVKVNHHIKYDNGREDDLFYWYGENVGMVKLHEEITIQLGDRFVKMSAEGNLVKKNF